MKHFWISALNCLLKIIKPIFSFLVCIFFMGFILFALTGVASATNYYVATWGNNADNGLAISTPWQNISYAVQHVSAGDTIYLINGTWYREYISSPNSGASGNPIKITAYNGTPTMDGVDKTDQSTNSGYAFNINNNNYITIDKLKIINYYTPINLWGTSSHINMTNLVLSNTGGIIVCICAASNNILLENSTFSHAGWNTVQLDGNESTNPTTAVNNVTIRNNTFFNNSGHTGGVDSMGYVLDVNIINNTLTNVTGATYFHDAPSNITRLNFSYNTIRDCGRAEIQYTKDSIFSYNTLYNSTGNYGFFVYLGAPSENLTLSNNNVINAGLNPYRLSATVQINPPPGRSGKLTVIDNTYSGGTGDPYIIEGNTTSGTIQFTKYASNTSIHVGYSGFAKVEFLDNRVFNYAKSSGYDPYYINDSKYYSDRSNFSLEATTDNGVSYSITTYPMTARPASGSATVTVNKFDTSLSKGNILVNFTASTTNGNSVDFTVSTLKADSNYMIKRDGAVLNTVMADPSGTIKFNNSQWPSNRTFTVEEGAFSTGNLSGTSAHVNLSPIPGAVVFLYTQAGTPYDFTLSAANGTFQFNNVPVGQYYINVSKPGFVPNQTSAYNVTASVNVGTLTLQDYDVKGDGKINVLDLNDIGQHFGERPGKPYPAYDVNGDGVVDDADVAIVEQHMDNGS